MNRSLKSAAILALSALVAVPAFAAGEDAGAKPWKNETEFSVVSANGNTKSTTSSGKNTFSRTWSKTTLELIGGGLGAKSQGDVTAEQYFASEKVAYKLTDRTYAFEKFGWDKDRFAGIRNRYDSNLGLGRELIDRTNDKLVAELGGGWTEEYRIGSEDKDFGTGRAYMKYTHVISPTANFTQDAEYIQSFEDSDDFRSKTETAVIAALNTHLSLKASYVWKHVGEPPVGFARNDTFTTVSLIAVY